VYQTERFYLNVVATGTWRIEIREKCPWMRKFEELVELRKAKHTVVIDRILVFFRAIRQM